MRPVNCPTIGIVQDVVRLAPPDVHMMCTSNLLAYIGCRDFLQHLNFGSTSIWGLVCPALSLSTIDAVVKPVVKSKGESPMIQ